MVQSTLGSGLSISRIYIHHTYFICATESLLHLSALRATLSLVRRRGRAFTVLALARGGVRGAVAGRPGRETRVPVAARLVFTCRLIN